MLSASNVLRSGEEAVLRLALKAHVDVPALTVGVEISDELGEIVFGTNTHLMGECRPVSAGQTCEVSFAFAANLRHGRYSVGASLHTGATHEDRCFDWRDSLAAFDVVDEAAPVFVGYCRLHPRVHWAVDQSSFDCSPHLQSTTL
jgi:lipopolysaccharide transport system ATP-binding protein